MKLKTTFITFHVLMLVSVLFGLAQPDAVNNGGVVELVRKDGILRAQNLFEEPCIRVEAAGVQNGVLATVELSNLLFEVLIGKEGYQALRVRVLGPLGVFRTV